MTEVKGTIHNQFIDIPSSSNDSNVLYDINIKSNEQALSIIIIKKCLLRSIAYKETFSLDKLTKLTHPCLSLKTVIEYKRELSKMIQSQLFSIKESNEFNIVITFTFLNSNKESICKDFILNKFQEDYETDINSLYCRINNLVQNQGSKLTQIQTKNTEIANRLLAIDQRIELINAFIKDYSNNKSKQQEQPYPHAIKPSIQNIKPNKKPNTDNQPKALRKTLPISKTLTSLNAFNNHVPITNWISKTRFIKLESLYVGSKCGFSSSYFHCNFDNAVPTVVLITLDNGALFGGFTCQTWKGENEDKTDSEAFLFSLNHNKKYQIRQSQVKTAIHCKQKYIVAFGNLNCFDLLIVDQGNKYECMSEFPNCYGNNEQKYSLTLGMKKFGVKEIEIFQVHYRD